MDSAKKCIKCGEHLPLSRFYEKRSKGGGLRYESYCKDCCRMALIAWRKKNPDKDKGYSAKWRKNHPEKAKESSSRWTRNNLERVNLARARRERKRRASDVEFKIKQNIRRAMRLALNGGNKANYTEELLGCSIEYLRQYLEKQFQSGMTWENYGLNGWHIDHIIPLSYFDFSDPEQQKRAWHYTNLQPLWAEDNRKKRAKIEEIQLILL